MTCKVPVIHRLIKKLPWTGLALLLWLTACGSSSSTPAPSISLKSPTNLTPHSATLNAIINPNGVNRFARFFWGGDPQLSLSYEELIELPPVDEPLPFSPTLTRLSDNTTYYYQLNVGTKYSSIHSFTTATAPSPIWTKLYTGRSRIFYNDSYAFALEDTPDGDLVAGGLTYSFGEDGSAMVLRLTPSGSILWEKAYGGPGPESAKDLLITPEGDLLFCGRFTVVQNNDGLVSHESHLWVVALDADGNIRWQKDYGVGEGQRIVATTDGGYAVLATTWSLGAGDADFWLLKLDANGNVVWQKTYGGTFKDTPAELLATSDGGYLLVGATSSYGAGGEAIWVLKLDAEGTISWQNAYGTDHTDRGSSATETADGGFLIGGMSDRAGIRGWALKLDPQGNLSWDKYLAEMATTSGISSIVPSSAGGYLLGGPGVLLKLAADESLAWLRSVTGRTDALKELTDGRIAAVSGGDFTVMTIAADASEPPLFKALDLQVTSQEYVFVTPSTALSSSYDLPASDTLFGSVITHSTILQDYPE
ncbi:MAG: hypothetical protein RQ754_10460 [Desulfuromonadales bacterium]|nr:hypothetical protein [Desulfuromonadales bacterium]